MSDVGGKRKRAMIRQPEPTAHSPYDSYLFPRSKTPGKQRLYDFLFEQGWRFDTERSVWHTPESAVYQAYGRLEYDRTYKWAKIQPPNPPGSDVRPKPILHLVQNGVRWSQQPKEAAS